MVCPIDERNKATRVARAMIIVTLSSKMPADAAMVVRISENSET